MKVTSSSLKFSWLLLKQGAMLYKNEYLTSLLTDVADISETISHKKFHEISSSFVRYNAARSDKTNS